MKRFSSIMIMFIVLVFALSACNFPGQEAEPTVDIVATQVAKLLTEGATEEAPPPTETMSPSPTSTEPLLVNSPTPSQTVTQTLTPTPTENLDDPAQQLGQAAWTQDFDGSTSPWDFSYEQATFQTANGYLTMTALANANWHSWYVSSPKLKNAYLEAVKLLRIGSLWIGLQGQCRRPAILLPGYYLQRGLGFLPDGPGCQYH